jgi:hypothetical protein
VVKQKSSISNETINQNTKIATNTNINTNTTQIPSMVPAKNIIGVHAKDNSGKRIKKQRLSSAADKYSQECFINPNILLHKINKSNNSNNLNSSDLDIKCAIKDLTSSQQELVLSSLNTLLKCSHGGDGSPLQIEEYPEIIYQLGIYY